MVRCTALVPGWVYKASDSIGAEFESDTENGYISDKDEGRECAKDCKLYKNKR